MNHKIYNRNAFHQSKLKSVECEEAVPLERQIGEILEGKENATTVPLIFTDKKDGVLPAYDIRTDKMEVAIDAIDYRS